MLREEMQFYRSAGDRKRVTRINDSFDGNVITLIDITNQRE